ncbi:MAG TPA: hypothetical protein VGR40_11195 [Candidatus Binatus sp.]|nr:hypothetical protein [Candidatus Binatus sp.]
MSAIRGWQRIVTAIAIILGISWGRPAFSAEVLTFPPTSFEIINPDTGATIGRAVYRVDGNGDGAIVRGENGYFDGQTDVETAHIETGAGGSPKLTDFDHTYYNPDRTIQRRAHVDMKTGAASCVDNSGAQKTEQSDPLNIPQDTWAGASIVIPIRNFLRAGDKGTSRPLHAFSCAPSPKIFSISVDIDPGPAIWTSYGAEAMRVQVRPDFGLLDVFVAAFVPKLHAWFDLKEGLAFVGDEAARYYKGPPIMLVKKHGDEHDGTRSVK